MESRLQRKSRAILLLKRGALIFYLIFSLPVAIVFLKSEMSVISTTRLLRIGVSNFPLRHTFFVETVSLPADGSDLRIGWIPFSGLNLAGNGYTVLQIREQVKKALRDHPKYIFIMAGSNDILSGRPTLDQTITDYQSLLALFSVSQSIPVITLVPLTTHQAYNDSINISEFKNTTISQKISRETD